MIKRITVIGAGATGHAVAAVMSLRGFHVTLYDDERCAGALKDVEEMGGISLRGEAHGIGNPARVTVDPAEAVRGAQLIFVNVMSDRHEEVARSIAPYLENGQHIMIIPGNLGAFVFRKVFLEMGVVSRVTLTEKEGNFCPCRLSGRAEVTIGLPLSLLGRAASLPSSDTARVLAELDGVVEYSANRNVFEGAINTGNVINHIASTILSAAEIDHKGGEFSLFKYAFTPSAVHCIRKIRQERLAVIKAMGMAEHGDPMGMIECVRHIESHPDIRTFYEYMDGPNALNHRYLHEDCGCGGAFAVSVARRLGLEMPVLAAFLGVAGAINDRDYLGRDGRSLENLGFPAELTLEEIYQQI